MGRGRGRPTGVGHSSSWLSLGRQICGQICKWSEQFKEFGSFYFCPNWRVIRSNWKEKLLTESAFFLYIYYKPFQKPSTAPQHLNVRSYFYPPRYPLLSPLRPRIPSSQTIPYFIRDDLVRLCHGNPILLRKAGWLLPRLNKWYFLLAVYCTPSIRRQTWCATAELLSWGKPEIFLINDMRSFEMMIMWLWHSSDSIQPSPNSRSDAVL